MICRDPLLGLLREQGYNVVRMPRTGLSPLQILTCQGTDLQPLGEMKTLLESDEPPPAIVRDATFADFRGNVVRSGLVSAELGLGFLGNLLAALGGSNTGLESAARVAETIQYTFRDVRQDAVAIAELDSCLSRSKLRPGLPGLGRLLAQDAIYVTTATLKCRSLDLEIMSKSGQILAARHSCHPAANEGPRRD